MQIFYNFVKIFQKSLASTFSWMSPLTKILATPLQNRTREEFMYEILFDVPPPNQNPGTAADHIYNLVDVIVSNF